MVGGGPPGLTTAPHAACEGIDALVIERSALGGRAGITERIDIHPCFDEGIAGLGPGRAGGIPHRLVMPTFGPGLLKLSSAHHSRSEEPHRGFRSRESKRRMRQDGRRDMSGSWLQAIRRGAAALSPAHRRRRRREAEREARRRQRDAELQALLHRRQIEARLLELGNRVRDAFGDELTLEWLAGLGGAVDAAALAGSVEAQREAVVGGLAAYGLRYSTFLRLMVELAPETFEGTARVAGEVIEAWARGWNVTGRADEEEARARYFSEVLAQEPRMARIAARAILKLPPGHPLRDEERVRRTLESGLAQAVELAGERGSDASVLERATEHALLAVSGLVEHRLASEARIESLLEAGRRLLDSPHLVSGGETFRSAAGTYLVLRADEARRRGEAKLAARWGNEAAALLAPLLDTEEDPVNRQVLPLLLGHVSARSDDVAEPMEHLRSMGSEDPRAQRASLLGAQAVARLALNEQDNRKVVETLAPVLPGMEDRYLSSVLDRDVAETGSALAEAAVTMAFAYAREGDFGAAAATVDLAKSLRFRYQALLRAGPLGEFLRVLEADIHAVARGDLPSSGRPESLATLLETYRQARAKVPTDGLLKPGVGQVAQALAEDEAVAILAESAKGLLLMVIRSGDDRTPRHGEIVPADEAGRMVEAMIDPEAGWLVSLGLHSLIEPRRSLVQLLRTTDEVVGARLAVVLRGSGVRRLTIIPHSYLHVVPWWGLPSLAPFHVMVASSAGQFVEDCRARGDVEPHALVVANPTGDLPVASIEAARVAGHLRSMGWSARVTEPHAATEPSLSDGVSSAGILHFAGHSRSDVTDPARSALEVHPDAPAAGGSDPLLALAGSARWSPVYRLAGTEWVEVPAERQADIPGRGHLEERIRFAERRVELRLEQGATGTLLGQYAFEGFTEEDRTVYGRRVRLSELWTAGDILVKGSLRRCGLAFLSSCEAGLGRLGELDEFAGLPAALQLAGASTVLSSLWPVAEETAAVFADLFYAALARVGSRVDVLELVHDTRHRLRAMTRDEAAQILTRLRSEAHDPVTRFRLEARISTLDPEPFAHPYEWAAFHVTGAPLLELPPAGRPARSDRSAGPRSEDPPARFHLPPPDLMPVPGRAGRGWSRPDPWELAEAGETLAGATDDPAVAGMAAGYVYERGLAHGRTGDDAAAERDFARALELDPGHVAARVELARRRMQRGDEAAALAHLEVVLAKEPDHATARLLRALAREGAGDTAGARDDLDAVVRSSADEAAAFAAHRAGARVLFAAGKSQAAVEALSEAVLLRPEAADVYLDRGRVHLASQDWGEALSDAARALFLNPRSGSAHDLLGVALLNTERPEEAAAAFRLALDLDPAVEGYHYHLGLALSDLGRREEALESFDRALETGPRSAGIHTDRGLVHAAMGHFDEAVADHGAALRLDPGHVRARYNRACTYSLKGVAGTIVEDLSAAFAADPTLRAHALGDDDLEWARTHLPEVGDLLALGTQP